MGGGGRREIIIESGRGWCRVLDLISLVNRRETTRMNREKPRGTKETREREKAITRQQVGANNDKERDKIWGGRPLN
jgi:hypothetical protein